jgi:hypothetical protein
VAVPAQASRHRREHHDTCAGGARARGPGWRVASCGLAGDGVGEGTAPAERWPRRCPGTCASTATHVRSAAMRTVTRTGEALDGVTRTAGAGAAWVGGRSAERRADGGHDLLREAGELALVVVGGPVHEPVHAERVHGERLVGPPLDGAPERLARLQTDQPGDGVDPASEAADFASIAGGRSGSVATVGRTRSARCARRGRSAARGRARGARQASPASADAAIPVEPRRPGARTSRRHSPPPGRRARTSPRAADSRRDPAAHPRPRARTRRRAR